MLICMQLLHVCITDMFIYSKKYIYKYFTLYKFTTTNAYLLHICKCNNLLYIYYINSICIGIF